MGAWTHQHKMNAETAELGVSRTIGIGVNADIPSAWIEFVYVDRDVSVAVDFPSPDSPEPRLVLVLDDDDVVLDLNLAEVLARHEQRWK